MNQHPKAIRNNVRNILDIGQVWRNKRSKDYYIVEKIGKSTVILHNPSKDTRIRIYLEQLYMEFTQGGKAAQTLFGIKN